MLTILDTADVEAIRHANEFYPIDGVTTNPTIISREKKDFGALLKEIRAIIGDEKMLHVQTTAETAEGIVEEGKKLKAFVGGNFYLKVPVGEEGLKATMQLTKLGIPVTVTAIFHPTQALMAAKAGAAFVAPYVNRIDNICGDGVRVVNEITGQLNGYGYPTKVLAASFKNVEQVHKVALGGCHSVTVSPDILALLLKHPLTDAALAGFRKDWKDFYGEKTVLDLI